jgi:hypothetical protein
MVWPAVVPDGRRSPFGRRDPNERGVSESDQMAIEATAIAMSPTASWV